MKKLSNGGANTPTGLNFEKRIDLITFLSEIPGYSVGKEKKQVRNFYLFQKKNGGLMF